MSFDLLFETLDFLRIYLEHEFLGYEAIFLGFA